jgi:hypothetical protein
MNTTCYVQRIKRPLTENPDEVTIDEVFSFGGGGSGLSRDAWRIIRPIMSFDYMGAAEYEFDALPKAFQQIVAFSKSGELIAETHTIGDHVVFVLGNKTMMAEIVGRLGLILLRPSEVMSWQGPHRERVALKEHARLEHGVVGGIDLTNGFIFTTDVEMFAKLTALFL